MSLVEGEIELVGAPVRAGAPREGARAQLIVVTDDPRPADEAAAAFAADRAPVIPNYYIDQTGFIRQFVADERAGEGLELAIFERRRRNVDRISISVRLERAAGADYSDPQVAALHRLLEFLLYRHGLQPEALATILPDDLGRPRVFPYLPPPTPVELGGELLGAGLDPQQQLFVDLYAETYKPRGGALKMNQAFPIHAAKHNLGAPIGVNEPPPVVIAGRAFNFQPYARDTIFNEGTDYAAVQSMMSLFDPDRLEIPTAGTGRGLLEASFRAAFKAAKAKIAIKGNESLKPEWRFHQVAKNAGYGPPLSGNYVSDDGKYAVQVFAGETLYTPMSDQAGCTFLGATPPDDPAHAVIWRETYKVAGVAYDPGSDFHRRALELKLGAPLTGVYDVALGGTPYRVQIWALDTLYKGPDGQIRRMSELPKPPEVQSWTPRPPKPVPPTPPNREAPVVKTPPPPATGVPQTNAGPPRPGDINWPPRPDFPMLSDHRGAREQALGHIAWVRARGDFVTITNGWDGANIVDVFIPQLANIPGGNGGRLKFHRVAAGQLQRLWAAWEAAGLLRFVKTFDGAWVPRTIRLKPTVLSNHAYGTAFDINARWNGLMRIAALVGSEGSVRELVPIANAFGFYWGGHWNYDGNGASDGMHFEWAVAR
jgi:hypothetical protein